MRDVRDVGDGGLVHVDVPGDILLLHALVTTLKREALNGRKE
jgi:hypothetical protein